MTVTSALIFIPGHDDIEFHSFVEGEAEKSWRLFTSGSALTSSQYV